MRRKTCTANKNIRKRHHILTSNVCLRLRWFVQNLTYFLSGKLTQCWPRFSLSDHKNYYRKLFK